MIQKIFPYNDSQQVVYPLSVQLIFYSFGKNVSIVDISFITSIAMLVSLIPISIAGLGVRESIAVYLFNLILVKPEITIIVYLINTLFNGYPERLV